MIKVLIAITAVILLILIAFLLIYLKNDKRNKTYLENVFNELNVTFGLKIADLQKKQDAKITEILEQQNDNFQNLKNHYIDSFEDMIKSVKISQEDSNDKVNIGIDLLLKENHKSQTQISENLNSIDASNQSFLKKISHSLEKYSGEIIQLKTDGNRLKQEMHHELNEILKEIKAPLDLD